MKYIRTKDGRIYDTLDERGAAISQTKKQCDFADFVVVQNRLGDFAIPKTEIVKQADTIEELCDEFVCLENKMTFHNLETITSSCNLKHLTIYGAIWTDKGLIFKARMKGILHNGKIDWELL